jgi:quercetin dioxygenase-like cupin family protein
MASTATGSALDELEFLDLAAIAAGLGRSAISHLLPLGHKRRWARVIHTDRYEAIVIAWPAGSGLGMHDHNGSVAAVHVVNGRLRERYVDTDGRVNIRWLAAGDTIELAGTHVHEVINLDHEEVVSVHVYSPPLDDESFRTDKEIDIT